MRAIAAFGIFAIHATGGFVMYSEFNSKVMNLGMFMNLFFNSGTQVFMMISGFVLFYNYRAPEEFNPSKFYKSKAIYLIIPYVIWSVAYFLFKVVGYNMPLESNWLSTLVNNILLGGSFSHLYYIFLIVQFYMIFPLLIKYLSKIMMKKPIRVFIITALIQAVILIYEFYYVQQSNFVIINFINSIYWKSVLGWFFYFISGGLIAYHYDSFLEFINKKIIIVVIAYIISLGLFLGEVYLDVFRNNSISSYESFGSIRPLNMFYGFMTFTILILITRKIKNMDNLGVKYLKFIGTYSLGIYFVHPMILETLKMFLLRNFPNHIGYGRVSSLLLILVMGWILTLAFCYLVGILRYRWFLIGKSPQIKVTKKKLIKENSK